MVPTSFVRLLAMIGAAILATSGTASAADVRVLIPAGCYNAYSELVPAFERGSGHSPGQPAR